MNPSLNFIVKDFPVGTLFKCGRNCDEKCYFQIQMKKIEYANSPRNYQEVKQLHNLFRKEYCSRVLFSDLEEVTDIQELLLI